MVERAEAEEAVAGAEQGMAVEGLVEAVLEEAKEVGERVVVERGVEPLVAARVTGGSAVVMWAEGREGADMAAATQVAATEMTEEVMAVVQMGEVTWVEARAEVGMAGEAKGVEAMEGVVMVEVIQEAAGMVVVVKVVVKVVEMAVAAVVKVAAAREEGARVAAVLMAGLRAEVGTVVAMGAEVVVEAPLVDKPTQDQAQPWRSSSSGPTGLQLMNGPQAIP